MDFQKCPKSCCSCLIKLFNSGDYNSVIHVSMPALGDKNWNLPCNCLLALPQNPFGVLPGHIIHRWKGMDGEIAAPLESWETVQ